MHKIILYSVLFICSIGYTQDVSKQVHKIHEFLAEEYPKDEPGAVVLIAKKGRILFKESYGLASLGKRKKLKTNMVFPIASMSKQFVSAAILQLVEEGKMSLQDPIQKYVPIYPLKKYPITIHHLLSQTSGIPDYFDIDEQEFYLLAKEHTPTQLIEYYKDAPLQFVPGTKWEYSNSNYPLLGLALENVTRMSLKEYLQRYIFQPIGMNSSGLWYSESIKKKRIPKGYNIKEGEFIEGPKMVGSALYAPGGIVSSVDDLFLWNRAMKNKQVLSKFVVDQLTTTKTILSGENTGYGYGFFLRELQGSKTIEHGGILFSYTSGGLFLPEEDIFVCILSNTKFDRVQEISNYIASVLINNPLEIVSKKTISKEILEEYVGVYTLQNEGIERVFEIKAFDNLLILHDPKDPKNNAILTSSRKDVFLLKAIKASFEFTRDENGQISGYNAQQKGQTYVFRKTKR